MRQTSAAIQAAIAEGSQSARRMETVAAGREMKGVA